MGRLVLHDRQLHGLILGSTISQVFPKDSGLYLWAIIHFCPKDQFAERILALTLRVSPNNCPFLYR